MQTLKSLTVIMLLSAIGSNVFAMSKSRNSLMKDPETVGPKSESLLPYEIRNTLSSQLLDKIAFIESTDGTNTDHPVITSGMHKGQNAVGTYGLMPKTIKEFSSRMMKGKQAPLVVKRINNMEDEQAAANMVAADPELEDLYAQMSMDHVIKRQRGDVNRAAYAWERGHNLAPESISSQELNNSEYVQKFRKLSKSVKLYGKNK